MPAKKRQHYVPRFLLGHFSLLKNEKQINLYNISKKAIIKSVSLKRQAAQDYFYGKDGAIEDILSTIETEGSRLLNSIKNAESVPKLYSPEHKVLLYLVLSLNARTLYKAKEQNKLINKFIKTIASHDPLLRKDIKNVEFEWSDPALISLVMMSYTFPIATDLNCKLIINRTDSPFILADNPVVFYNQFLENRNKIGSNTGLAAKGLEIFLPINPKHMIVFYDHKVYKLGSANKNSVEILNSEDIASLNGLQLINANENIYFNEYLNDKYINDLAAKFGKYRNKKQANVDKYDDMFADGDTKDLLIFIHKEDIRCNLKLSVIKILKRAKKLELSNNVFQLRNPNLMQIFGEFDKLVKNNYYKENEFKKFLYDKLTGKI